MAFKTWRTGVHIQQDKIVAVSLTREKVAWRLRRWWQFPLKAQNGPDGALIQSEQLADLLSAWSKALPLQHRVALAFPAVRTLQKALPSPAVALRDSESAAWIVSAISRELEMPPEALCFDYTQDTFSRAFHVTAAQNRDVASLLALAKRLKLRLAAITPDAAALANLLPFLPSSFRCVAWRDEAQWLWAMRHQWGRKAASEAASVADFAALLAISPQEVALFHPDGFDPFTVIACNQPPLPAHRADFTVALALALGESTA